MFQTMVSRQTDNYMNSARYVPLVARMVAVVGVIFIATPAFAETQIGAADTVVRHVTGKLDTAIRKITVRDQVFQDDLIETKDKSATELIFLDGTKISIGPNAKLTLDAFVYNPDSKTGTFKMSLAQGAARFVSGNLSSKKKANYEIATPTVTIGVRGTKLKIVVDQSGATAVELDSQSDVDVANSVGDLVILDHPNAAITSTPAGAFIDADFMPPWANAAIHELDTLLSVPPTEQVIRAEVPPPPPPPPVVVAAAPPPPPPAEPEEGLGLDQAQIVANDNALNGGLVNSAVGRADTSAQGLGGSHGGGNGGSNGGGSGKSSNSSSGAASASASSTATRGNSAAAKSRTRGRSQE